MAQQEGLVSWSTCPKQAKLLETFLEGLPSKPHGRGDLAAQGVKLYEYRKQNLDELKKRVSPGFPWKRTSKLWSRSTLKPSLAP